MNLTQQGVNIRWPCLFTSLSLDHYIVHGFSQTCAAARRELDGLFPDTDAAPPRWLWPSDDVCDVDIKKLSSVFVNFTMTLE